ncbi:protoheme IX farnesyltransferase, mitochondrial [Neltuma alba]|uniref:protoheme IX farnesyltransferase, mitochondrial n=1 Tax=Neltuma alba TaxID=207710 RepID=UPI0010A4D798|nr:protoheme IX farnesyltransferase, mitochondrial [Prosopis alba]
MRSSLRFYSKLLQYSSRNINPPSFSTDGVLRLCLLSHSHRLYSSSSVPDSNSSLDSLKLGLTKSDGLPAVSASSSSAGAVDLTSLVSASASKAREIVDLTRHYSRCYWELSKARLSLLVVATSGTGFVLGSSSAVDFPALCWTCMGTMMVAASANSLNQVFEINNDAKMKRTSKRPLPSGRITVPHAVNWASSVGLAGTALIATKANMLAAGLAASNLVLYAFVYTPLKQIHPVNTWVGAVVGAVPPLLGWAAAAGDISLNALILPAALYFWQIPHFMALAYMCRSDYAAGGFKMYSLADPTGLRTASVALRNSIYLIPLGFLAYDWGVTSGWFCLESLFLTAAITASAFSFYRDRTKEKARRMFYASLLYLPVFMSGLLIHRVSDNQLMADNAAKSCMETSVQNEENVPGKKKERHMKGTPARPPVAYASVAPFPFLPAPLYDYSL